jgi:hypothetical protein
MDRSVIELSPGENAASASAVRAGETRALGVRLGRPELDVTGLAEGVPPPRTAAELEAFVRREEQALVTQAWPLIAAAHRHAAAGEARELVALARDWNRHAAAQPFAEASFRVGLRQLNRLRPLADHRVVRRLLAAAEAGEVRPWHPLVYGLTLAVFHLPLRPGLAHFAEQTLGGFIAAAPAGPQLAAAEKERLHADMARRLPGHLAGFLPAAPLLAVG